jgi:hypothetical protein
MKDLPTRDFMRWDGRKFRGNKKQNPATEFHSAPLRKSIAPLLRKSIAYLDIPLLCRFPCPTTHLRRSQMDYVPEPDYELVYPRIARTLERLCAECGFNKVLGVFSNDMPCHRREREQELKNAQKSKSRRSKSRMKANLECRV